MRSDHRVRYMLLTAALAVSVLTGCSNAEEPVTEPLPNEGEIGQQILDGEALVAERCSVCHDLQPIDDAAYDAVGWEATVSRMVDKGAKLTAEEQAAVIEYLSNR